MVAKKDALCQMCVYLYTHPVAGAGCRSAFYEHLRRFHPGPYFEIEAKIKASCEGK